MNFDRPTPHRGGTPMADHLPPPLSDEMNQPPPYPWCPSATVGYTQTPSSRLPLPYNLPQPQAYVGHPTWPPNQVRGALGPYQQLPSRAPNQGSQEYQQLHRGAFQQDIQECALYPQIYPQASNQVGQHPYPRIMPGAYAPHDCLPHQTTPQQDPHQIRSFQSNPRIITSTTSVSHLSDDVFYPKSISSCPPSSSAPDSQVDVQANSLAFGAALPPGDFGDQGCYHYPLPPLLHCPIMMLRTDYNQGDPGAAGTSPNQVGQFTPVTDRRQRHPWANVRQKDKDRIRALIHNKSLIQVCGPPMAGKSTLVKQVITDLTDSSVSSTSSSSSDSGLLQHHFDCKGLRTFTDLATTVINKLRPGDVCTGVVDSEYLVSIFQAVLSAFNKCHHVIVFHKCETFRSSDGGHFFLDLLAQLLHNLTLFINVTVIFTTYKTFPRMTDVISTVQIGVLTDIWDVVSILQFYAPGVEVLSYAHVCIKTLCLPEAVRLLAEKFIAKEEYRIPADLLEKKINRDARFLSEVFGSRVKEVAEWIPEEYLLSIVHFCHSVDSSFEKAHLEYVSSEHDFLKWTRTIQFLKENFVVREVSVTRRLVIHPLVIYYCQTAIDDGRLVLRGQWYDQTCNKYTNFLCRLLMNTEASMRQQGRKGLVYSGLILEWPNVKYLIERALQCNGNTYGAFVQIAVSSNGLIMKCFMKEAKDFYQSLYNSAREYGSSREVAVLQAFLGNAIGASSGISKALTAEIDVLDSCHEWHQAISYLNGAIEMLSQEAPSYHLMWALDRKATILHRQGKYKESLQCFKQAKQIFKQVNSQALGEQFFVSDLQIWEERITQEIQETIPIIFTGNNKLARKRLDKLLEIINYRCENHPELSTLLNLIGLTEERGNNNLTNAFKWYKLSYNERMYLAKMCPEILLVSLNNMAMVLLREGKLDECLKYLSDALDIRRECGWMHYSTALTLTHLSEVNIKCDNFPEAFKNALEAEKILRLTVKDHDMRLRLNFTLAHIRVVLRQKMDLDNSRVHQQSLFRTKNSENKHCQQAHTVTNSIPKLGKDTNNVPNLHELFDDIPSADSHSPPWTRSGSRESDTEVKVCPGYQCSAGQPVVTTIHIDPVDLSMSANNYFDRVIQIAHEMTGTLSDDGHNNYLATHMHAMVLNWNDKVKFLDHLNAIKDYTNQNPWIEETVFGDESVPLDSRYNRLRKHKSLFYYIVNTPVEHLDLDRFIQLMIRSCHICGFAESIYTCEMWRREAHQLMCLRRDHDLLDGLETVDLGPDVGPQENWLNHCSYGAAVVCNKGDAGPRSCSPTALDGAISSSYFQDCNHKLNNNIYPQSNSMDNNLSRPVESPKILQDQQDIMNKIKSQRQPCMDDLNITNPKGNNFACTEHQKKGSGGSKVILDVRTRVPVEQSETFFSGLPSGNNNIESHMSRGKHDTCRVGAGGGADKLRLNLQPDPNNYPPGKLNLHGENLSEHVESSWDSEHVDNSPENEHPQKFSVRHYLREAWPEITLPLSQASTNIKQSVQAESTPSLSDQRRYNRPQNDSQPTSDPEPKVLCIERQSEQSGVKNSSTCAGSRASNSCVHKGVSTREGEKTNSRGGDGGRLSFAESGFVGSSLSSEDDHPSNALSQSGHSTHNINNPQTNLTSGYNSNLNAESGFLSHGAKPKIPKTEIFSLLSCSNQENYLDSQPPGHSGGPELRPEAEERREPAENCEDLFSFSHSRKPEEGLWCDYSGQNGCYSEEGFQTVISPENKDGTNH